jgi:micrococcal nuclease
MRKFLFVGLIVFVFLGIFFLLSNLSAPKKVENKSLSPSEKTQKEKLKNNSDNSPQSASATEGTDGVLVIRVVDGDTIEIEGGQKVRYIGIDTPEVVDPRKPVQCFGKEASNKNKELVDGKRVRLEKDVSETDKYGRLLRYIFLPAGKAGVGDLLVNEVLVKEGYAFSSTYPPDVKYQDLFGQAEKEAREANRGLWGSCGQVAGTKTTPPATDCVIKGNISSSGEKIYHIPGQRYYNQTVIDETKGEKWFCTEEEAQKVGWRKSKV